MSRKATLLGLAIFTGVVADFSLAQEEKFSSMGAPKRTSVGQLRANPTSYKNVLVTFTGQFMGMGAVHNPFFTRFTRAEYVNFAAWGIEQRIWDRDQYDSPLSSLFSLKKGNEAVLQKIYHLQRYQRVECTGIVRNVFQGEPWIEVITIEPFSSKLNVTTLAHMARGSQLMKEHRWLQAVHELNTAFTSGLPAHTIGWIHGYLGICFMRAGQAAKALSQLRTAKGYLGESSEIEHYLELLSRDPKAGIDTQVAETQVPKALRPMWEAYEESLEDRASKGRRRRSNN